MSSSWGKLEGSFRYHHKFSRLAEALDITRAHARGLTSSLWAWAIDNAPDGDLSQLKAKEIEEAADWEGEQGKFIAAASSEDVRLLDKKAGGYIIHDFYERAALRKEAQRKAEQRERKRKDEPTVYVIDGGDRVKIGYSADLSRRMSEYVKGEQRLIAKLDGGKDMEAHLHRLFRVDRIGKSEWFTRSSTIEAWLSALITPVSGPCPSSVQLSVPEERRGEERTTTTTPNPSYPADAPAGDVLKIWTERNMGLLRRGNL